MGIIKTIIKSFVISSVIAGSYYYFLKLNEPNFAIALAYHLWAILQIQVFIWFTTKGENQ